MSPQLRVLVVEDEPDLASVIAAYLRGELFEVTIAGTGPVAISMAKDLRPDLVVLDIADAPVQAKAVARGKISIHARPFPIQHHFADLQRVDIGYAQTPNVEQQFAQGRRADLRLTMNMDDGRLREYFDKFIHISEMTATFQQPPLAAPAPLLPLQVLQHRADVLVITQVRRLGTRHHPFMP